MQNTRLFLLIGCLLGLIFTSCDNELDIAADWKEVAIIYGVLNPTDANQYIRIQRVYLDEDQRALNFSSISDSLYFDSLVVEIIEFKNGGLNNTAILDRIDGNTIDIQKDTGVFASDVNYLYHTDMVVNNSTFANEYVYQINLVNPKTGYTARSNAISVGKSVTTAPISIIDELLILDSENHKFVVRYEEGKFARSYDVVMDFKVLEKNKLDTSQVEEKVLRWTVFRTKETKSLSGFNEKAFLIPSVGFYNFMQAQLPVDSSVFRRLDSYDLRVYGINDDLYTFINVNKPSIGIVQKKPEFTNIEGGLGIFATRYIETFENRGFSNRTRMSLINSELTKDLGFVPY